MTFRLQPGDRLQLVFHRGAKVRADSDDFAFEDATGLLEWASADRATVTLRDLDDVHAKLPSCVSGLHRFGRAGEVVGTGRLQRPEPRIQAPRRNPEDLETLVELAFRDLGESTEVVLTQRAFKTEARRELHRNGWTDSFDKLDQLISQA